jgi:hypothetical protein
MYKENEEVLGEETFQMLPVDRKHQSFTLHVLEYIRIKTQYLFNNLWSNPEHFELCMH